MNPKFRNLAVAVLTVIALAPKAMADVRLPCVPELDRGPGTYRPCPQPSPYPGPKPCNFLRPCPSPFPGPRPLSELQTKTTAITAAVSDKNLDKASTGLDGLFTGAGSQGGKSAEAASVVVPASYSPISGAEGFQARMSPAGDVSGYPVVSASAGRVEVPDLQVSAQAGRVATDAAIALAAQRALEAAARRANEAANRYVNRDQTKESIEKYGGCRMKNTCPK